MRKAWKRALSLVLSAALVVTAGAFGNLQGESAKAADGIDFTATINSFGGFWGWDSSVCLEPATGDVWSVKVEDYGDYTLKVTAPTDWEFSGAFVVNTDLTAMPTTYQMVPKTVKIGSTEYDWSKGIPYKDGEYIRMSIWNEWGKDNDGNWDPKANSLVDDPTDFVINKGDEIEIKFSVVDNSLFTATLNSFGGFWAWDSSVCLAPATGDVWSVKAYGMGDYSVEVTAPADWDFSGAFALLTNLTDMPTDYDIVGKEVEIGDTKYDWSKGVAYKDGDSVRLSLWNEWGKDENGNWDPKANPLADDPTTLSIKKGDKIKATFTVKAKPAPPTGGGVTTPPTGGGKVTTKVNGAKEGAKITVGNFTYKVTKAATITSDGKKKTAGKVTVVGLSKNGKKASSINVKNSVKKGTASYAVTAVGSKAFQKAKKLKKATLGSKITTIPASAFNADKKLTTVKATGVTKIAKNAFAGCAKLSKLTLGKKQLKSVAKKAFKGCKKTIKVSGGSKKVKKANVKKLKKSGYKKFK